MSALQTQSIPFHHDNFHYNAAEDYYVCPMGQHMTRIGTSHSIEPEAVFGQMKFNMANRRFRHFGKDKVKMDFVFFAIAFNIKKMCSKIAKQAKNGGNTPHFGLLILVARALLPRIEYFLKILKNQSPENIITSKLQKRETAP